MESDWEIEIDSDASVIDAAWEGYVDLRSDPTRVQEISETAQFPALAEALIRLNSASSPVWTAKCDVWPVEAFDPDEMDANPETATAALGCYIDLLPADVQTLSTLEAIVEWCTRLCLDLRARPLRQSRADAIVRRAFFTPDAVGLGITVYLTTCAATPPEAAAVLAGALPSLADSVLAAGVKGAEASKYNESIVGE